MKAHQCKACGVAFLGDREVPNPTSITPEVWCDPCDRHRRDILGLRRFEPNFYVPAADILARRVDEALDELVRLRQRLLSME